METRRDPEVPVNDKNAHVELKKIRMAGWLAAFGCALLVAGLVLPPLGVIDNTVLVAAGEIFIFSASIMGIKLSYEYKVKELISKATSSDKENEYEEDPGDGRRRPRSGDGR